MYSQSAPPSACISDGVCFPISDEPVEDVPVRAFYVAHDVVLLRVSRAGPLGDGPRVCISLAADDELISGQERLVHARGMFTRSEEESLQPTAENADMSKGQGRARCLTARALVF